MKSFLSEMIIIFQCGLYQASAIGGSFYYGSILEADNTNKVGQFSSFIESVPAERIVQEATLNLFNLPMRLSCFFQRWGRHVDFARLLRDDLFSADFVNYIIRISSCFPQSGLWKMPTFSTVPITQQVKPERNKLKAQKEEDSELPGPWYTLDFGKNKLLDWFWLWI